MNTKMLRMIKYEKHENVLERHLIKKVSNEHQPPSKQIRYRIAADH